MNKKTRSLMIISVAVCIILIGGMAIAVTKTTILNANEIFATNESGLTYGRLDIAREKNIKLDLYAALGINGLEGYIYATDLEDPIPSSPKEAIEIQKNRKQGDKEIPVYAVDGYTVIDTFIISSGSAINIDVNDKDLTINML